ncbi:MAG: DUF4124 domain-containing protein [Telluria sp.]
MTSRAVRHTLFIAGLVLASSTFAGTDVLKCTDPSGHVTLTDQPCPANGGEVVFDGSADAADEASAPAMDSGSRYRLASLPPAPRLRARPLAQPPGRALARDVATLKQAHRALLALDSTMSAARHQGLAAK